MKKKSRGNADYGGNHDLFQKILFTLLLLVIYRLGSHIPLPGVNVDALNSIMKNHTGGILGMFNVLTGGSLGRMSIFTLNIMPYITASIVIQLITSISKEFSELRKSGEAGRQKINFYSKCLAVMVAIFQGYGIAVGLETFSYQGVELISDPGYLFRLTATLCLMSGTVIVIWFADQIALKGIGNGSSVIIFAGIVSGFIPACGTLLRMGHDGALSIQFIFICIISVLLLVGFIVFVETSQKRIKIQYPSRQVGNKMFAGESSYLPMKINMAGVIPPIFASSLLLLPTTVVGFQDASSSSILQTTIATYLGQGKPLYISLYVLLIFFFCYFYSSIIFNPEETADNLRKSGAYVAATRPGKQTSQYLKKIISRLNFVGASYIAFVCAIPELAIAKFSVPFYIGGTSVLIVIGVVLEISSQIQSHLFSKRYERFNNKVNIMRA